MSDYDGFGYGGKKPVPCSDHALKLGMAIIAVIDTDRALTEARREVPDYTGQYSSEDYYANELEAHYRACERFERVVGGATYEKGDLVLLDGDRPGAFLTSDDDGGLANIEYLDDKLKRSGEFDIIGVSSIIKLATYPEIHQRMKEMA